MASDAVSAGRSRGTMEGVPVDDSRVCTDDGLRCSVASTGSTGILVMGMDDEMRNETLNLESAESGGLAPPFELRLKLPDSIVR